MLEAVDTRNQVVDRKAIAEIFSNFSDIVVLNRELLRRLDGGQNSPSIHRRPIKPSSPKLATVDGFPGLTAEAAQQLAPFPSASPPALDQVGMLLLPLAPFLKTYSLFIQNFSRSLSKVDAEERTK